VVELPYAG